MIGTLIAPRITVFPDSHINDSIQFCIQGTACTLYVMPLSIALLAAVINAVAKRFGIDLIP